MGLQPLWHPDIENHALVVQHDLALGQVKLQWAAMVAGMDHDIIGSVKRAQDRIEQWTGLLVNLAINGGLDLLIAEFGSRTHQNAMKAVVALAAIGTNHHADSQGSTGHALRSEERRVGKECRSLSCP